MSGTKVAQIIKDVTFQDLTWEGKYRLGVVTIGTVFGPKRRTSSFGKKEDGVSYLDLVIKEVVDPRKLVGRYTSLLGACGGHNAEDKFFKYGLESVRI